MAELFGTKPESDPLRSTVLGTLAMFLQFFGYLALGIWMKIEAVFKVFYK